MCVVVIGCRVDYFRLSFLIFLVRYLVIVVIVYKRSRSIPSDHLCINIHTHFDLGGGIFKHSKVNFRSCSLIPVHVLPSDFIYPPVVPLYVNTTSNSSRRKVDAEFTLTTTDKEDLPEVEAEEVENNIKVPRNTSRNPNIRNDVDCYGVR